MRGMSPISLSFARTMLPLGYGGAVIGVGRTVLVVWVGHCIVRNK